jgi:hypothetical protein
MARQRARIEQDTSPGGAAVELQKTETTDFTDGHGFGWLPTKHTKHAKGKKYLSYLCGLL